MSLKKFLSKDIYLQLLLIVPAVALAEATGWDGFRSEERIVSTEAGDIWR